MVALKRPDHPKRRRPESVVPPAMSDAGPCGHSPTSSPAPPSRSAAGASRSIVHLIGSDLGTVVVPAIEDPIARSLRPSTISPSR